RINAAARLNGTTYSRLMGDLKKADIQINRKMLAQLAVLIRAIHKRRKSRLRRRRSR
ncbi:MAG: 50S ribosomal protein L20, partial [Cyanobacteria bacterium J06635_11]